MVVKRIVMNIQAEEVGPLAAFYAKLFGLDLVMD